MKSLIRIALVCFLATGSFAATIKYAEFPAGTTKLDVTKPVVVTLPCYGDVRVTVTGVTANTATQYNPTAPAFVNQPQTVGPHSWTSASGFGMFLDSTTTYTVTFDFLNGVPNPSQLVLVMSGLLDGSTATLSAPVTPIGELTFPSDQLGFCGGTQLADNCPNGSAPTKLTGGTVLSSNKQNAPGTDPRNTGWALYHPQMTTTKLTMTMNHQIKDGLTWSLGYLCDTGLTVKKEVAGAPAGFKGTFAFLVECMTKNGLVTKTVTADWPSPGSAVVTGIPGGSSCKVVESQNLPAAPDGFIWASTTYSPEGGVITTGTGTNTVTVTNTLRPCRDKCDLRIVKRVEGAPAGFSGTFTGTLRCWINGTLTPFPVSINYPTPGAQTITNLPLGASCTFEETGRAALPAPYQWLPPLYSKEFGQILLAGACTHELVVTNRAKLCCTDGVPPGQPDVIINR